MGMIKVFKSRKKRSILWKIPLDELKLKVESYFSLGQVLRDYGLKNKGRNSHTLKQRLVQENIDFSHFRMGIASNKGRDFRNHYKLTLEECMEKVFVVESTYGRTSVKRYLHHFKLKPYECKKCGQLPVWNSEPLTLQLDHENGISNDHRLDNLRWICPNCHTQTTNFAGKQKRY